MPITYAEDMTGPEFAKFISERTVAILPVAAIEPHGPHLPLATDCDIARGHLGALQHYLGNAPEVLVLPLQTIGLSIEHDGFAGLFSHPPETLLAAWSDVIRPFRAAGGRRLIIVSSHGGNSEVVSLLTGRLRAEFGMLAVSASWLRFGQPEGMFEVEELAHGIHGGAVETSLMLHYWPQKVRTAALRDFQSAGADWDAGTEHLKTHGRIRPGWLTRDLNPAGAVGNARAASAEKGAASAHHSLTGFAALIAETVDFDLARFGAPT